MVKSPRFLVWMLLTALLATVIPFSALAAPTIQSAKPYSGHVVGEFTNCGLTQVFGTVVDASGNPQTGVTVRLWWSGGETLHTTAGTYVRPETSAAGWDFTLQPGVVANTWYVAIVDDSGNLLSEPVEVRTDGSCNPGDTNAVKVEFRNAPSAPSPPAPEPPDTDESPAPPPSDTEAAPPVTAGAECEFYGETGGFYVCDDTNASFLSTFEAYGLTNVGYPISRRFMRDGFITQAYQKAVLQQEPNSGQVNFVNVLDELSARGLDQQLYDTRQTPFQLPAGWEGVNVPFEQAVALRQALLNERPALRQAYFSVADPLLFFGLPTSEVEDMGNHYAIRLQRAVLQEWKEDVPWARAGDVTVANGGDIAKQLGHFPDFALVPDTEEGDVPDVPAPPPPPDVPPPPSDVPPEPPRVLDHRLDDLGVTIEPAFVESGQPYWRVVEIIWHDESQSGGRHSIYVDVLDESGAKILGHPVTISWGGGSQTLFMEPKPAPEYGVNFPMYAAGQSYTAQVDGLPSDKVHGLGLGDLDRRDWTIHVEYFIKYQKVIKP